MLSYCFKCRRNTKSINLKVSKKKLMVKQLFCQHVLYAVVKNQNLLNNKKHKDY